MIEGAIVRRRKSNHFATSVIQTDAHCGNIPCSICLYARHSPEHPVPDTKTAIVLEKDKPVTHCKSPFANARFYSGLTAMSGFRQVLFPDFYFTGVLNARKLTTHPQRRADCFVHHAHIHAPMGHDDARSKRTFSAISKVVLDDSFTGGLLVGKEMNSPPIFISSKSCTCVMRRECN